jgi:hypothetical protein
MFWRAKITKMIGNYFRFRDVSCFIALWFVSELPEKDGSDLSDVVHK